MIKVVLFDADGVIVLSKRFSDQLQEDYGIPLVQSKKFFQNEFQKCLIGESNLHTELPKYLKKWNWKLSIDDFIQYWFSSSNKINLSLISTAEQLRKNGIKCYIATNQEAERTKYMNEEMEFSKLFDGIYSSSGLGSLKPSEEFFKKILSNTQCTANEILFLDDSMANVQAARLNGMNGELYSSHEKMLTLMNDYGLDV